jgi:hypothetical protein
MNKGLVVYQVLVILIAVIAAGFFFISHGYVQTIVYLVLVSLLLSYVLNERNTQA